MIDIRELGSQGGPSGSRREAVGVPKALAIRGRFQEPESVSHNFNLAFRLELRWKGHDEFSVPPLKA